MDEPIAPEGFPVDFCHGVLQRTVKGLKSVSQAHSMQPLNERTCVSYYHYTYLVARDGDSCNMGSNTWPTGVTRIPLRSRGRLSVEYHARPATLYSESGCNAKAAGEKLVSPTRGKYPKDLVSFLGINS